MSFVIVHRIMNQKEINPTAQTPETDFVSFYLEQESRKSNVYYASARPVRSSRASGPEGTPDFVMSATSNGTRDATLYYKVLPGKVVYKKTGMKIAVALAAVCLVFVSAGAFFAVSKKQARLAAESGTLIENGYEEILSAQKALAGFRLGESFFGFNSAYQSFSSAGAGNSYLSALASSAAHYWPFNLFSSGDGAVSDFEDELVRAGLGVADSFGSFLKAVQARDAVSLPAALEEIKSAQKNFKETRDRAGDYFQSGEMIERFDRVISYLDLAVWAAGADRPRTFLAVIQNTSQARATGGAIVSAGAFTVENGQVSKIYFDDVFNIDGQLQTKVIPPKPIQKMDTVWSLHNANWFLDFPTSAEKIAYFYQKSQDIRPDGVIALNEKALLKLLEITGPVELLKYDLTIDKDNFSHLTAFNILDEKRASQTKRVFNDFTAALFGKLFFLPEDKLAGLFDIIKENAGRKDALLWLSDEKYENIVSELGWGGEVSSAEGADYLAVGVSNMTGASNALSTEQSIVKETEISENGEIINTVRVERKYVSNELPEKSSSESVPEYWRFYVPKGSELVSVSGFAPQIGVPAVDYSNGEFKTDEDVVLSEKATRVDSDANIHIFQESDKAVYGGWVEVSSEYPTLVAVKYKLPFSADARGEVDSVFQKQPGVESELDFKTRRAGDNEPISIYNGDFSEDLFFNVSNDTGL